MILLTDNLFDDINKIVIDVTFLIISLIFLLTNAIDMLKWII